MLDKILWTLFYIISSIMIVSYIFYEKRVTNFIDNKCEKYIKIDKLYNLKESKYLNYYIYLILIIYILIAKQINYNYDPVIQIKNKIVILTILGLFINILVISFKKFNIQYNLIISTAMYLFGKNMFAIDDKYFSFLMMYIFFSNLILLIFLKDEILNVIKKYINIAYVFLLVIFIQNSYIGNYAIPTGSMEKTIMVGDRIISNNMIYKYTNPKLNDIISFKEPLDNNVFYTKRITGTPGSIFKINENDNNIYLDNIKTNLNRKYSIEGLLKLLSNPSIYIPKKNDRVKLDMLIEFDVINSKVRLISVEEFLEYNIPKSDYKKVFGVWNSKTLDQISDNLKSYVGKRFTFILKKVEDDGNVILPILDFKYDNKIMEKLLNYEDILINDDYYMAMGDNTKNSNDSRYFGYVKKSRIYGKLLFRWYPFNRIGRIENGN